jgi:lisH domain-containing protein FOPNL
VFSTLESSGSLNSIKAQIRAEIFAAIDCAAPARPPPQLSNSNLLINELIREYLLYNQLHHSLSVLIPESGQPVQPAFERAFIAHELGVVDSMASSQVPLLYTIVEGMRKERGAGERGGEGGGIIAPERASVQAVQRTRGSGSRGSAGSGDVLSRSVLSDDDAGGRRQGTTDDAPPPLHYDRSQF